MFRSPFDCRPSVDDLRLRESMRTPSMPGGVGWVVGVDLGDIGDGFRFADVGELRVKPRLPVSWCETTVFALGLPSDGVAGNGSLCKQILPSASTSHMIAFPGDR